MGLFQFIINGHSSELERILKGIEFREDLEFNYYTNGEDKKEDKEMPSPVYIIPLEFYNNAVCGYFNIEQKKEKIPLGLLQIRNFLFREHFMFDLNGNLRKMERPIQNTSYLQLKLTDLMVPLGKEVEGKFIPFEKERYSVFGIEGTQGKYPVLFVSDTEKGVICKGLYKGDNGLVEVYNHPIIKSLNRNKSTQNFLQKPKGTKKEPQKRTSEDVVKSDLNWQDPQAIMVYLAVKDYKLELDPAVAQMIAKSSPEEIGARGLSAVCTALFTPILFNPEKYADSLRTIYITPDLANQLINYQKTIIL